jgi:hypothetical protein
VFNGHKWNRSCHDRGIKGLLLNGFQPKASISDFMGTVRERKAIRVLDKSIHRIKSLIRESFFITGFMIEIAKIKACAEPLVQIQLQI